MRVLQAMAGAEFGGAEAFFERLIPALSRAGLEQEVLIRTNPKRAALLKNKGVEAVQLPFGGKVDFRTSSGFKKAVKQFGPDVVVTWMNRATSFCPKSDKFVHVARLGGYYDLKYYKHCDHLVGNTKDIVHYLVKEGWPEDKAHYLPNFVDAQAADPIDRKAYYTPRDVPLILAMGRLHENKAFDVLLKAVASVPDAYLWLAGEGPERKALEKLAEDLSIKPRVRFLGWRDDTAALLATCDLFVCPSRHEPLGNVVLEAWAHGKPVVAADALGPGTLIENEENGILVPVDDHVALYRTIRWVLSDPELKERFATRGKAAFDAEYTEQAVVAQYLAFFETILKDKGGA